MLTFREKPLKTILITSFEVIKSEHHLINLLFCEGLETLHLRKKDFSQEQMERYILKIAAPFRTRIVLHSHFELITKYKLKGAHFTKADTLQNYLGLPAEYDLQLLQKKPFHHISFSLHSIQEIKSTNAFYDYIFLSPVFDSISNRGYNSKFKIGELKALLKNDAPRPKIIALSGINPDNVAPTFELGFDGIAMLGYIWTVFEQDHDLVGALERFNRIKKLVNFYQHNPELISGSRTTV